MQTCDPRDVGFDPERLNRLTRVLETDLAAERFDGCALIVARHGRVAYHRWLGWADRAERRPIAEDQVFVTMSIGKQFTNALVLNYVERGAFALTTPIAEIIPEFGCRGKDQVAIWHVLTHTGGLPALLPPMPIEEVPRLPSVVAATCATILEAEPGSRVTYSVIVGHSILGEVIRRIDGGRRPYRQIMAEDLFQPLGMTHTSLGARPDLAARMARVVVRDRRPGALEPELLEATGMLLNEEAEIPAGGYLSTVADVHRFAEMLRGGGALDGVRILSPAMVEQGHTIRTGALTNSLFDYTRAARGWAPFPANIGLGFFVRGTGIHPTPMGTLASPATFGGFGAGSTVFWVDPVRDVTYAFLSTGLMEESRSMERHQRLSDLVHAAVVDRS